MIPPVEPPTLDEIHQIVERRRRTRYRATQGVVSLAVVAAIGYGVTRPQSQPSTVGPGDSAAPSSSPLPDPSTTSTTALALPTTVLPADTALDPPDTDPGLLTLLDPAAPAWLEEAGDAYTRGPAATSEGFTRARAIADDWGVPVAETKAVLGVATAQGQELTEESDDLLVGQFLDRGGRYEDALAIAGEWRVEPLVVKMLAALDVAEVPLTLG